MSQISAKAVNELRQRTDMPLMKCKAALEKAAGDIEKAILVLREEGGKFMASDKGARETAEGRIAAFSDNTNKVGAIVEVRCESPSVVKNDRFIAMGQDIARQVAEKNPANVDELLKQPLVGEPGRTVQDRIADVVGVIRENMRVARFARVEGMSGSYTHHDGSLGVLIQVTGEGTPDEGLLRDLAAHIAAFSPTYAKSSEVPSDVVARERDLAKKQTEEQAAGKPANIIEKIAEGKYQTWLAENVFVEQPAANQIKYGKKTVGQLLKEHKLDVVKFIRFKVGEKA
ncbi:MAG: translation elongation factor Ts [Gemmataceae bacterium]